MAITKTTARSRDALNVVGDQLDAQPVSTGRTRVSVTNAAGAMTVTSYVFDAKTLLDAIAAQTAGVAGPARTITRNANGTLTIA